MFQGRRHCLWYLWCSLCVSGEKALCVIPMVQSMCFRGEGIVCDTCVNVSGKKTLSVIPVVQSVCFRGEGIVCNTYDPVCVFQGRRHCVWYLWFSLCVSGKKTLSVIPMVQSVCFRGEGVVCDTHWGHSSCGRFAGGVFQNEICKSPADESGHVVLL